MTSSSKPSTQSKRRFDAFPPSLCDELRDPKPYFEDINVEPKPEALGLAKELIEAESGRFEPEKIPDKYAETLRKLLRDKVEQRAPQIEVETGGKGPKGVINIMAALKQSKAKRRARVRDAVRRRMGKPEKEKEPRPRASRRPRPSSRRTAIDCQFWLGRSPVYHR
jgi:DNA end-binding protein Ku